MTEAQEMATFVTARLGEWESAAMDAGDHDGMRPHGKWNDRQFAPALRGAPEMCRHIALHDPATTLRLVESYRMILARYEDTLARQEDPDYPAGVARDQAREYEDFVLPNMAALWSTHPEYRESWKPWNWPACSARCR